MNFERTKQECKLSYSMSECSRADNYKIVTRFILIIEILIVMINETKYYIISS